MPFDVHLRYYYHLTNLQVSLQGDTWSYSGLAVDIIITNLR